MEKETFSLSLPGVCVLGLIALGIFGCCSCSFTQTPDGSKAFTLDGAQFYNVAKIVAEK